MKIFETIKTKVNNGMNKAKAWSKKHPTATKVIAGTATVVAVGGAALGVYAATRKQDEPDTPYTLPEIPEIPQIEAPKIEDTDRDIYEEQEELKDREVWEKDKEDWQKVLDVSKTLSNLGENYDGYHIYKLDDEVMVARTTDEGSTYHYAPEQYDKPAEHEPQTEGAE